MKRAASLGGTFRILLPGLALSTGRRNAEMTALRRRCDGKTASRAAREVFTVKRESRLNYAASADSKGKPVGSGVPAVANACSRVNP
jgi:hypothetical protein